MLIKITAKKSYIFLISLIFAQNQRANMAKLNVLALCDRLSIKNIKNIINFNVGYVAQKIAEKPALHRFPRRTAQIIINLVLYLRHNYDEDPRGLWEDASSIANLREKIEKLPGFGHHMTETAIFLLVKEYDLNVEDYNESEINRWCHRLQINLIGNPPALPGRQ